MELKYTCQVPDKAAIFNLYEVLEWNSFLRLNESQLLLAMENSWLVISCYYEDKLVGTGRVISDGITNAYLCGLGVLPEYRKLGIGTEISKKLVEECKQANLHIQFFCEERLVPYYEGMGFKKFAQGMRY